MSVVMRLFVSLLDMSDEWVGSTDADDGAVGFGTYTDSNGYTVTGEHRGGGRRCGHWVVVYFDGDVVDYMFDDDGNCISSVSRVSDTHQTTTTITNTQ
jgi:hypothetical protein